MQPVARNYKNYYGPKCDIINVDKCQELSQVLEEPDYMNCWGSIGFLAIQYFLTYFPVVHITGFDGMKGGHYFKKQPNDSKFHNWQKEQEYIQKLTKEGKVILL
jgi:hypothetical protein